MITNTKEHTKTLKTFRNAVKDKDKTLVGVYYRNPTGVKILAEPEVSFSPETDEIIILLKPDISQEDTIDLLSASLVYTDIGEATRLSEDIGNTKGVAEQFFSQATIFSNIVDYELRMIILNEEVNFREYKIGGVNYYQYEVSSDTAFETESFRHSIILLFKDKEYSAETFFSTFSNKDIDLASGKKILDTIANENITGMFLGIVEIDYKDKGISSYFAASSSISDLITNEDERGEVQYIILTDESSTTFNKKDIKKVSVNATINQVYNYSIDIELTGGVVITLYLG